MKELDKIKLIDNSVGLNDELLTHYKRQKYLHTHFDFIDPEPIPIGTKNNRTSNLYTLPIQKTLGRLIRNESLRRYIIKEPPFFEHNV